MSTDGNEATRLTDEQVERQARNKRRARRTIPVAEGDLICTIAFTYDASATPADRAEVLALLTSHSKVINAAIMTRHEVDGTLPENEGVSLTLKSEVNYAEYIVPQQG